MVDEAKVYITDHAYERMKQRLGLGRKAANKMAQRAFERGLIGANVKGGLNLYLCGRGDDPDEQVMKFLYGEHIFVFRPDNGTARLLTVYRMDSAYLTRAISAQRRYRKIG